MRQITKQVYEHGHMPSDVFGAIHPELDPMGKAAFMPLGRDLEEWLRAADERH